MFNPRPIDTIAVSNALQSSRPATMVSAAVTGWHRNELRTATTTIDADASPSSSANVVGALAAANPSAATRNGAVSVHADIESASGHTNPSAPADGAAGRRADVNTQRHPTAQLHGAITDGSAAARRLCASRYPMAILATNHVFDRCECSHHTARVCRQPTGRFWHAGTIA